MVSTSRGAARCDLGHGVPQGSVRQTAAMVRALTVRPPFDVAVLADPGVTARGHGRPGALTKRGTGLRRLRRTAGAVPFGHGDNPCGSRWRRLVSALVSARRGPGRAPEPG